MLKQHKRPGNIFGSASLQGSTAKILATAVTALHTSIDGTAPLLHCTCGTFAQYQGPHNHPLQTLRPPTYCSTQHQLQSCTILQTRCNDKFLSLPFSQDTATCLPRTNPDRTFELTLAITRQAENHSITLARKPSEQSVENL